MDTGGDISLSTYQWKSYYIKSDIYYSAYVVVPHWWLFLHFSNENLPMQTERAAKVSTYTTGYSII